jgi:hypothetical protein
LHQEGQAGRKGPVEPSVASAAACSTHLERGALGSLSSLLGKREESRGQRSGWRGNCRRAVRARSAGSVLLGGAPWWSRHRRSQAVDDEMAMFVLLAGRNSFGRDGLALPHRVRRLPAFPASTPHLALDILKTRRHALQDPLPTALSTPSRLSKLPTSFVAQTIYCLSSPCKLHCRMLR